MSYCLRKELATKLIQAAKDGDVIGKIDQLYEMTNAQRREAFAKHLGMTEAKQVNAAFEKAMSSNQQTALADWAKKTFNAETKKSGHYKSATEKIKEVSKEGLLTPENTDKFLEDLVTDRLGISITPQEAQRLSELSQKVEEASGLPLTRYGPDMEFWKAKRTLDNYIDELTPAPQLKIATSVIGRATMLFSLKSPFVNIESNTVNAISEAMARRIEAMQGLNIPANPEVAGYMKYANNVYLKTGYDITRMYTFEDGRKRLGEEIIHSQGPGKIRKLGRFYTDVVFNKLMTAPDVAFASFHFADAANLYATAMAKAEGLSGAALQSKVSALFLDAIQIEPKSEAGQMIRSKAILEGERGTYTNKSNYSKLSLGMRKVLNDGSGDLRLGDQLMPFVKLVANVAGVSFDYSGITLPVEILAKIKNAVNAKKNGDPVTFKQVFDANMLRKSSRAGIGITVAFIMSSLFDPEDFIGEYPTTQKERELLALENASENSIRVGKTWISLDYFGPLAAPFIGMMSAKKYGSDPLDKILRYAMGTAVQASRIPGFRQFYDLQSLLDNLDPRRAKPEELRDRAFNYIVDFFRSRTLPAIVSDFAKGLDPYQRETAKYDVMERLMRSIPGLRQMLPTKVSIFGEEMPEEGLWSSLFFGSRRKTRTDEPVVNELSRLAQQGQLPSITDIAKTSPRAKQLKEQIGEDTFREAYVEFGQSFKEGISELLSDSDYQDASDEEKKDMIDKLKQQLFEGMLENYGYEKPEEVSQNQNQQTGNLLFDLVGKTHAGLVGDVLAAEDLPPDFFEKKKFDQASPSLWEKIKTTVSKIFGEIDFVSPESEGEAIVEKGKQPSATGEYPYLVSHDGEKVIIHWPTGGTTEARNEIQADQILKTYEERYKELTGEDWPVFAPSKLKGKESVPVQENSISLASSDIPKKARGIKERTKDSDSFVETTIVPLAKQYGVPPAVAAGQFGAEGRLGGLGADRNNFFNIGAFDNNEDNAYSYNTPEDGVKAYMELLKRRYESAFKYSDNPKKFLQEVKRKGYASRKDYVDFVMGTPEWRQYSNK